MLNQYFRNVDLQHCEHFNNIAKCGFNVEETLQKHLMFVELQCETYKIFCILTNSFIFKIRKTTNWYRVLDDQIQTYHTREHSAHATNFRVNIYRLVNLINEFHKKINLNNLNFLFTWKKEFKKKNFYSKGVNKRNSVFYRFWLSDYDNVNKKFGIDKEYLEN